MQRHIHPEITRTIGKEVYAIIKSIYLNFHIHFNVITLKISKLRKDSTDDKFSKTDGKGILRFVEQRATICRVDTHIFNFVNSMLTRLLVPSSFDVVESWFSTSVPISNDLLLLNI